MSSKLVRPRLAERRAAVDRRLPPRALRRLPRDRERRLAGPATSSLAAAATVAARQERGARARRVMSGHRDLEVAAVRVMAAPLTTAAWNASHGPGGSAGSVNVSTDAPDGPIRASEFRNPAPCRRGRSRCRSGRPVPRSPTSSDPTPGKTTLCGEGPAARSPGDVRRPVDGEHERQPGRRGEERAGDARPRRSVRAR